MLIAFGKTKIENYWLCIVFYPDHVSCAKLYKQPGHIAVTADLFQIERCHDPGLWTAGGSAR